MTTRAKRGLLSMGVFLVIVVVSILLYLPLDLIQVGSVVPLVLALFGCWVVVLAGMRSSRPQKYERRAFSTFAWGLFLIAIGGAWFMFSYSWIYSIVILLLVMAALVLIAALKK